MNKTRVIFTSLLLCFVMVFLSGCRLFSVGDDLLLPPRAQGELGDIQDALSKLTSNKITLKYPTAGEYRSAIVQYDLTGNGVKDAVAFYSTESENISAMHIAVITKRDGKWVAAKDVSVLASGVERVEFDDLDGDGTSEIIVGWSVYAAVDKEIGVYGFDGATLTPHAHEKYTEFLRTDLDTDQKRELFLVHLNSTDKTATARLLTLENDSITEIASCHCDGSVSGYLSVASTKLLNGKPAVFVDAQKGTGAITEVFYLDGEQLINPLFDRDSGVTTITERPSTVVSSDINGDSTLDIPMLELLPEYRDAPESDRVYITRFCTLNGENLVITLSALMNYTDGYYFTLPKTLDGNITLTKNIEARTRTIYLYDKHTGERKAELFTIKTVNLNNWETSNTQNWHKILEDKTTVYAVLISDYNGPEALSFEQIKSEFNLIGTGD